MIATSLPPFLVFAIGAFVVALLRGRVQATVLVLVPLVGLANLLTLDHGVFLQIEAMGNTLRVVRVDKLSLLFGYLFHVAALLGIVFSLHMRDTGQHVAGLLYAGSALGAVFAGDLITFFLFWELLALTSVFLIWARRTERAYRTGLRYLLIQMVAGLIFLAGVLVRIHDTGWTDFDFIGLQGLAAWLIFIALGIKCGFPLLHNWLTDSYPEATPTGTVFLSAFTTKVAVYALARGFPGTELLVYVGAAMTMFPIFFAVIENDLRRVLSYSLINQVGFMVCGIGIGSALALNGAVSHAFNDVVFKALLFMAMGAVLFRTGKINGSELGGLFRSMPWTTGFCIVGAASISAFPLFSGFVSKSMVMLAAQEHGYTVVWLALLFASAGVFHHAGIKIPFFAFFAHDSGLRPKEAPLNMLIAMGLAAAICIFNGAYPWVLYDLLPFPVDYRPYDATHVVTQMQLLFFSALAFAWLKLSGLYPPELPSVNLDAEWVYRRVLPDAIGRLTAIIVPADRGLRRLALVRLERFLAGVFRHHGPQGALARSWPTGSTAIWVAALLGAYLIAYYV